MNDNLSVEIRIDPACPWAWLTSRWLAEAEKVRALDVRMRLLSLYHINRQEDGALRPGHESAIAALRLLVATRRSGGDGALARLYGEIGERVHERGEEQDRRLRRAALEAAGLEEALEHEAMADPSTLAELVAENADAVSRGIFGVPTIEIAGCAPFFGPVIDRRITGEAAGELWDHVLWTARQPYLFELKRNRTSSPRVGRLLRPAAA